MKATSRVSVEVGVNASIGVAAASVDSRFRRGTTIGEVELVTDTSGVAGVEGGSHVHLHEVGGESDR